MNDLSQLAVILRYHLLLHVRMKRFYILLGITALLATLSFVAISSFGDIPKMTPLDLARHWVSAGKFLVVLTAISFGGQAIAGEYQNRTGYFLFPNPVRREVIYLGKFMAAFVVSALTVGLYWGIMILHVYVSFWTAPGEVFLSLGLALLYTASMLSLTFLISTLFRSGTTATAVTVVLYFFAFGIISFVSSLAGVEPWFMIDYASEVVNNVLIKPYPPHIQEMHVSGLHLRIYNPYLEEGVAVMLGYLVGSAVAGILIFRRKEMR